MHDWIALTKMRYIKQNEKILIDIIYTDDFVTIFLSFCFCSMDKKAHYNYFDKKVVCLEVVFALSHYGRLGLVWVCYFISYCGPYILW